VSDGGQHEISYNITKISGFGKVDNRRATVGDQPYKTNAVLQPVVEFNFFRTASLTPGLTSSRLSHYHSLQGQTMLVAPI